MAVAAHPPAPHPVLTEQFGRKVWVWSDTDWPRPPNVWGFAPDSNNIYLNRRAATYLQALLDGRRPRNPDQKKKTAWAIFVLGHELAHTGGIEATHAPGWNAPAADTYARKNYATVAGKFGLSAKEAKDLLRLVPSVQPRTR